MTTTTELLTCLTCDMGLHHCHAPIVEHADGSAECLAGCGGPRAIHDESLPCIAAACRACATVSTAVAAA